MVMRVIRGVSATISAFWGSRLDILPFSGEIPQKNHFCGVNRRFQAKLVKSKNMHIIKTTASIPTKFCTAIRTTKCPSWVVGTHTQQIQDGGGRHLEKSKNRHIPAIV